MKIEVLTKKLAVLLCLVFFSIKLYSQDITLKGKLLDKADNSIIVGATVRINLQKNNIKVQETLSDNDGEFEFYNLIPDVYIITISYSGYVGVQQKIALQASNKTTIPFLLNKSIKELQGVTIISKPPPIKQNGDTTEFKASEFKVNPDATAEDLIKKLPGITVAQDGTVTAMGEQVQKVTVDGKDFFGDDATAALRNLPAEVIDKIQVFDRLSDQAQLTGFDDGNSVKSVNIVTKSGMRNGQFGRIFAGAGVDDNGVDGRYNAGGNVSFFKGDRRISLVGNFNNINQQNFSSQDLLGISSGGRGGGSGSNNYNVGQASGINQTNAAGINYSNVYNKKLTLTSSYFFNNSTNSTSALSNIQTFYNPKNLFSAQNSSSVGHNNNHRINMRLEYKIDSANSLFIIPNLSFQNNKSNSFSTLQNYYDANDSTSNSVGTTSFSKNGYSIGNNIMFRHSFVKKGRSISVGLNTVWSKNDGNTYSNSDYKFYNNGTVLDSAMDRLNNSNTNGTTISGNIIYTEPIGKKGQLQLNYTPTIQKNSANQQTYNYDGQKFSLFDTALSNQFDNKVITNNGGINFRYGQGKDFQLMFGASLQHTQLESQRTFPTATFVSQPFTNVLPNLMFRKKIGKYNNIRIFYRTAANFPSINQLQDIVNQSNPLAVSSGNPALKQSYSNTLNTRYTYTNTKTSRSFFANLFLQTANNYITNATFIPLNSDSTIQQNILLKKGSQFTKPVNLNGYQSIKTFFTYSTPLKNIKSVLNLNAGFSYSKLPGLINNSHTITNSYAYNTGVVLASNISEFVDFNLSYAANFNSSNTNTTKATTSQYVNQTIGGTVNLLSKKGWFLQSDVAGNIYSSLSSNLNQHFWLWNASAGKKILKKKEGEIKLSVFDILHQNQSVVRTITGTSITDAQTKVLQQYFMLTFTYKLKNFGTPPSKQGNKESNGARGGGGGFGEHSLNGSPIF